MATFKRGYVVTTTPLGVLVNLENKQQRLVKNGLNKRISRGAEVLVAKNESAEQIIGKHG